MSTKNIARTIIEGGRTDRSKWSRRHSHRVARRAQSIECHKMTVDPEIYDDEVDAEVETEKVYKEFDDKLNPLRKWVNSKVGRNWNKVYSDVRQKFDVRTTPGRHIVEDHMMTDISGDHVHQKSRSWWRWETKYKTNAQGVLVRNKNYNAYRTKYHPAVYDFNRLANFYGSRIVGRNSKGTYFWFVPSNGNRYRLVKPDWRYWRWSRITPPFGHQMVDKNGVPVTRTVVKNVNPYYRGEPRMAEVVEPVYESPRWRQDRKLTKQEIKHFESLPETIQEELLKLSPIYVPKDEAA